MTHPTPDARSISKTEMALRRDLAAAYRLAAHFGWDDGISTHFSVRLPGPSPEFLISPFGSLFEEVSASNLVKVGRDGEPLSVGNYRVNAAGFAIHGAIHMAREDALCIMHCHTVAGIAVGAQEQGLRMLSGHAMSLFGRVGYYADEGNGQDELLRIVGDLGANHALMLRNHGTLTVGNSVAACFWWMYYLERSCAMQVAALSDGAELVLPPLAIARQISDQVNTPTFDLPDLSWAAMIRKLDRIDPSYRD